MTDAADQKRFRSIIWLLPAAYVPHIVEEYVGGFPVWVTQVVGGSFNNIAFALNNAAFMTILLVLTAWTSRSTSRSAAFLLDHMGECKCVLGRTVPYCHDRRIRPLFSG
jgi:hypothetical protein